MIYGSSLFNGTIHFERPTGYQRERATKVPFTAEELETMYGLTVEEALERGFSVVGHRQKKRSARMGNYTEKPADKGWQIKKKPSGERQLHQTAQEKISQDNDNTILEECQMEDNKKTTNAEALVCVLNCVLDSEMFMAYESDTKRAVLSVLLRCIDAAEASEKPSGTAAKTKHPGGRGKKKDAAPASDTPADAEAAQE